MHFWHIPKQIYPDVFQYESNCTIKSSYSRGYVQLDQMPSCQVKCSPRPVSKFSRQVSSFAMVRFSGAVNALHCPRSNACNEMKKVGQGRVWKMGWSFKATNRPQLYMTVRSFPCSTEFYWTRTRLNQRLKPWVTRSFVLTAIPFLKAISVEIRESFRVSWNQTRRYFFHFFLFSSPKIVFSPIESGSNFSRC